MAKNVIRQDIIEVDFKANTRALTSLITKFDTLKENVHKTDLSKLTEDFTKFNDTISNSNVKDFTKNFTKLGKAVDGVKNENVKKFKDSFEGFGEPVAETKFQGVKNSLENIKASLSAVGDKAVNSAYNGLKKVAGISFKAVKVGIAGATTAVAGLAVKSVKAYSDYQQLVGGVQTLFGTQGAKNINEYAKIVGKSVDSVKGKYKELQISEKDVISNANDAYKKAGLSANEYMETVTSFSASLISSVGGDTKKAAKLANTAIIDMADNANKMGTDMGNIQQTYQSISRGNYGMLDNLKLGYGGTKREMERLVKEASKLDKSVDASSMSYANIVKAIHAVQDNMGITGTTTKEAKKTISGSLASLKATWGNLMPALIEGGDSFDQCIDNLVDSALTFEKNVTPAILKALSGIGKLIVKLAPEIEKKFPELVKKLLPPLLKATTSIIKGLIKSLPDMIQLVVDAIPDIVRDIGQAISEAFGTQLPSMDIFSNFFGSIANIFSKNKDSIQKFAPALISILGGVKLLSPLLGGIGKIASLFKGSGGEGNNSSEGLLGFLSKFAKAKPKTILKGIVNLGIILGGLTTLATILMAISPYISQLSDLKSVLEIATVMTVLGTVGAVFSKVASLIGTIPVIPILKGLANIGIVIGGLSILYLLIGAVSLVNFNIDNILNIVKIMTILGVVGSVMAVFAGIVGVIPIEAVLLGIANIALVITGLTALIVAFGALSKIPEFNDFVSNGGDTLALVFKQIGKIGGAIVGGFGESLSASLPQIGKNLVMFVDSVKPIFEMVKGVDVNAVGNFFNAMAGFMLKLTAGKLLSAFTGEVDYFNIGSGLSSLISALKTFFSEVVEIPQNAFDNSTKLFECLAGIGNLPKSGGLAQWFAGDIDYSRISAGLSQLGSSSTIMFFSVISNLPDNGFESATKLFECLAGIDNLPKSGGLAQWFAGDIDYSRISAGLSQLGESVGFFSSVAQIPDNSFEKVTALFSCLAHIEDLPKSGGFMQWFQGDSTSSLSRLGDELVGLSGKISEFVNNVNTINGSALSELSEELSTINTDVNTLSGTVNSKLGQIVNMFQTSFTSITNILSNIDLSSAGSSIMNGLISGINSGSEGLYNAINNIAANIQSKMNSITAIANSISATANSVSTHFNEKTKTTHSGVGGSFANGGIATEPSIFGEAGAEMAIPLSKGKRERGMNLWEKTGNILGVNLASYSPSNLGTTVNNSEYNTYSPQFTMNINGTNDDRTLRRKVKQWITEAMEEVFESIGRINDIDLQEV